MNTRFAGRFGGVLVLQEDQIARLNRRDRLDGGVGAPWHPDPNRCYFTVTQPYCLKNAKCGVMLHRIR